MIRLQEILYKAFGQCTLSVVQFACYAVGHVGGVVWIKLSEVYSKSLPRQIGIIVAVTNAIITGVDGRTERGGE